MTDGIFGFHGQRRHCLGWGGKRTGTETAIASYTEVGRRQTDLEIQTSMPGMPSFPKQMVARGLNQSSSDSVACHPCQGASNSQSTSLINQHKSQ
jgi:hypothetical protein